MYNAGCGNGKNGCNIGNNFDYNRDRVYIFLYLLIFTMALQMELHRSEMDDTIEMDKNPN